jgi:hypothetical protein
MAIPRNRLNVAPEALRATQSDLGFACMTDQPACQTESFIDRDVELTRCLETGPCRYRQGYNKMSICSCTVQRIRPH